MLDASARERRREARSRIRTRRSPRISTPASPSDTTVSSTVQVASVSWTVMFRYSFTSQKPPSLTCDAISEPAPIETTSSSLFTSGSVGDHRRHDARRGDDADGGRTDREPQQRGDDPAEHQRRQREAADDLRDRLVHAGRHEDAAEAAAGADDQQHAGDRRQRLLGELQDAAAIEPARAARTCRAPAASPAASPSSGLPANIIHRLHHPIRHRRLHQRGEEHQEDRREDRQQRDRRATGAARAVVVAGELIGHRATATFIRRAGHAGRRAARDERDRAGTRSSE